MKTRLLYTATISLSLVSALALAVPRDDAPTMVGCAALHAALTPSTGGVAALPGASALRPAGATAPSRDTGAGQDS